jgi:hypothetical protein
MLSPFCSTLDHLLRTLIGVGRSCLSQLFARCHMILMGCEKVITRRNTKVMLPDFLVSQASWRRGVNEVPLNWRQ